MVSAGDVHARDSNSPELRFQLPLQACLVAGIQKFLTSR